MSFHDILLHPWLSYGVAGGPRFSTEVVIMASGKEQRNRFWQYSGGTWDAAHGLKTQDDLDDLVAFFRNRWGRAYSFRFLDWTDYSITSENIGSFNGSAGTKLQIIKTYTDNAGFTFERQITKPVDVTDTNHTLSLSPPSYTTMTVTIGGSAATEGVDYSVNYSTGEVEDLVGVSGAVVVSCSFHVHARFDTDQMQVDIEFYDRRNWGQIPVIELKFDETEVAP